MNAVNAAVKVDIFFHFIGIKARAAQISPTALKSLLGCGLAAVCTLASLKRYSSSRGAHESQTATYAAQQDALC